MAGPQLAERSARDPILLVRLLAPQLDYQELTFGRELLRSIRPAFTTP